LTSAAFDTVVAEVSKRGFAPEALPALGALKTAPTEAELRARSTEGRKAELEAAAESLGKVFSGLKGFERIEVGQVSYGSSGKDVQGFTL